MVQKTERFTEPPRKPFPELTERHLALLTAASSYFLVTLTMQHWKKSTPTNMYHDQNRDSVSTPAMSLLHDTGMKSVYGVNRNWPCYIIEEISGISLDKYLKKVIFDSIGMNRVLLKSRTFSTRN